MKLCPSKQNLVTNIFRLRCFPPVTSEQAQTVYFWGGSGIYRPKFFRENKDNMTFCDLEMVSVWNFYQVLLTWNFSKKILKLEITVCPSQVPSDIMRTKLCKGLIKSSSSVQREIEADCGNETKHLQHLLPKGIRNIIRMAWYFI